VPAVFALMEISPSTVDRVAPPVMEIFCTAVRVAAPLPDSATAVDPPLISIDVASPVRFLSPASVIAPATVNWSNGAVPSPIVKPAVKSGTALIRRSSVALPRLIVTVPEGLAKSVCSKATGFERSRVSVLPVVPSSSRIACTLPLVGRSKTTSVTVPVFVIGARPV